MKHQRIFFISLVIFGLVALTACVGVLAKESSQSQAIGPTFGDMQVATGGEAVTDSSSPYADPEQRIVRCCYGMSKSPDSISSPYADPEQRIVRCCFGRGKSPDSISSSYADPEQRIVRCCFGR